MQVRGVALCSSVFGAVLCAVLALAVRDPLWLALCLLFIGDAFRALETP